MIEILRFTAPPIRPYADFVQLLSPLSDRKECDLCCPLNRQLLTDDQLHERVWVIYLAWLLLGKLDVVVFRGPVLFQIVVTIAPPWALFEWAIDRMREERPHVPIPLLPAVEHYFAYRAHLWLGVLWSVVFAEWTFR